MLTTTTTSTVQSSLGTWTLLNHIGSGATSSVYQAQDKESRQLAAVKVFRRSSSDEELLFKNEASIMKAISHPNIVNFIGFEENIELALPGKKPESVSVLQMELVSGGEFFNVVQELGSMSETIGRTFFSQILSAVAYLHSKEIAHMDLKLENLLMSADNSIKIGDFGSAIKVSRDQKCQGLAGTLRFQPPEALAGEFYSPYNSDVFALGIILFLLVVGYMPFGQADASDPFYGLINAGDMTSFWDLHQEYSKQTKKYWRAPSKDFKDLFAQLVNADPSKRIKTQDIVSHKWMKLDIVDNESLSVWMKTKKRVLTKAKTAPVIEGSY